MKNKITILLSILLLMIYGCQNSDKQIMSRVDHIASSMIKLDSISDFSSNNNNPVKDVQNIGPDLYKKLRLFQKTQKITYSVTEKENDPYDIERYGNGQSFVVKYINSKQESLRYFLLYSSDEDIFRITGY